jgi:hypothetical protein
MMSFVNFKDSKLNGFQAALFLTPPKINSDSIQSSPGSASEAILLNHLANSGGNYRSGSGLPMKTKGPTPNSNHIRVEGSNEQAMR